MIRPLPGSAASTAACTTIAAALGGERLEGWPRPAGIGRHQPRPPGQRRRGPGQGGPDGRVERDAVEQVDAARSVRQVPGRPDLVDPWYELKVCASAGARVQGVLRADTPYRLDELATADTVIVPACHDVAEEPPTELVDAVRAAHERGARVASICTGAFVLAAAGLLDGRRATTHWMHATRLASATRGCGSTRRSSTSTTAAS